MTLERCRARCAAKSKCQAFHYSAAKRICGLKAGRADSSTLQAASKYQTSFQAFNKLPGPCPAPEPPTIAAATTLPCIDNEALCSAQAASKCVDAVPAISKLYRTNCPVLCGTCNP